MELTTIGIDISKKIFQIYGSNKNGKAVLKRRLSRKLFLPFLENLPPCLVGMEACGGSHYWAREIQKQGHTVKIMGAQYVKPYVKGNKNDYNDAEAICEAVNRGNMHFVPIKSAEQLDVQAIHRIRQQLKKTRTALGNQMRGLLIEHGIVIPKGIQNIAKHIPIMLENEDQKLSSLFCDLLRDQYAYFQQVTKKIIDYDRRLVAISRQSVECQRLEQIPGVGPTISTAMVSAVGDFHEFTNGRQLSAWLGLVPRQYSSGDRTRLGGISKRGNRYLRALVVQGAKSAVWAARKKNNPRSRWISNLEAKSGANLAAVAVANKNVRVMWALVTKQEDYKESGKGIWC